MNVLMLLRSELRRSAAVLAGIAAVLALSLSISIATGMTDRMLRHASAQAADRFDLLIGAKASPSSLLLGAVFLRDEPLPLVPLSVMKDLDERHGVKWAAPVAFGDRAGDSPIVGTTTSLVTFGGTVRPAEGRLFKAPFEAVVGASAPYRIGDEIVPMHGRTPGAGHAHDHGRLKVVGRMPESGTPWDRAVMIPIEAVWATHSMTVHDELERAHGYDHEEEDGTEHEYAHEEGHGRLLGVFSEHDFETLPGVSAVVVKPASFADAYRLRQQQSQRTLSGPDRTSVNLMGVFSGEVLVSLHSLLGGASEAVTITARLTLLTALAATLIMGVLLGELRRPALEQLRVLGAPQRYIMSLVWCIVMTSLRGPRADSSSASSARRRPRICLPPKRALPCRPPWARPNFSPPRPRSLRVRSAPSFPHGSRGGAPSAERLAPSPLRAPVSFEETGARRIGRPKTIRHRKFTQASSRCQRTVTAPSCGPERIRPAGSRESRKSSDPKP